MALPFLPESLAEPLSCVEVELDNLTSVYEASAVINAILGDIQDTIEGLDESAFDPAKVEIEPEKQPDEETKKERILNLITSLRNFDTVPDWKSRADYEDTYYPQQVVRESCRSLITQFKILAIPFLPDYIVNHLNSIDLGGNLDVDEAMTVVNTLLPDSRPALSLVRHGSGRWIRLKAG